MKTLQNNFTTPEQSKRLLELGVPAWTADLYFYEEGCISNDDEPSGVIPYDEVYQDESKEGVFSDYAEFPCWSVGRLIEIYEIVGESAGQCVTTTKGTSRIENLVKLYEENATLLDFSKLDKNE